MPCSSGKPHSWLVGSPNGTPDLPATCRLCGAERTFPASPEAKVEYMASGGTAPSWNNPPVKRTSYDTTEHIEHGWSL